MAEVVTTATTPTTSKAKTVLSWLWGNVLEPVVQAKVSAVSSEIQSDAAKYDAQAAAARAEAAAAGSSAVSSSTVNKVLVGAGIAGLVGAIAIKMLGKRRR